MSDNPPPSQSNVTSSEQQLATQHKPVKSFVIGSTETELSVSYGSSKPSVQFDNGKFSKVSSLVI